MRVNRVLVFLIVLLFVLVLVSCSRVGTKLKSNGDEMRKNLLMAFEGTAEINYGDTVATVEIKRTTARDYSIKYIEPPSLQSLTYEFADASLLVSYRDMSFDYNPDSLPATSVAKIIASSVSLCSEETSSVETDGDTVTIKAGAEFGECYLQIDKNNANIKKLSVPSAKFEMDFINFTYL